MTPPVTIKEFQKLFERLAPPDIAWKGDNVGLQIGRESDIVRNIVVALDVTMDVAVEAVKKKANLIVTHHPLIFQPLRRITPASRIGEVVLFVTEHKLNLYAAHTNLDSVKWGVNYVLAKTLGLNNISILSPIKERLTKITVFVPHTHVERVAEAMHNAGAGMFTKYDQCSFRGEGTGTFRGMNDANPFLGEVGKLETVKEIRLEMLCETWKLAGVITAMLKAHPYEEVAYDVYPLLNENTEYGIGAIGDMASSMSEQKFLHHLKKKLKTPAIRYSSGKRSVRRVAVVGGSGSEFIEEAITKGADALVTADLKYHTFQDYNKKIMLVDTGHYETEHLVLPTLAEKIKQMVTANKSTAKVFITQHTTNSISYYS